MTSLKEVDCPTCGKKATWQPENKYRPFCSERCQLIDLGAWAGETHRIPGQPAHPSSSSSNDQDDD
jgi:uncharacterized protein